MGQLVQVQLGEFRPTLEFDLNNINENQTYG